MKKLLLAIISISLLIPTTPVFALPHCDWTNGSSKVCTETVCGPIMCGITNECRKAGNCQLFDIMQVIANVGNMIFALAGSIVFLMFIIGGIRFLASRGASGEVQKGKDIMKNAVIGLLIILGAGVLINTVHNVLRNNQLGGQEFLQQEQDRLLDRNPSANTPAPSSTPTQPGN